MTQLGLKRFISLITLVCFLALVLPFCVPSAMSFVLLPGDNNPPPSIEDADPDDIAVNSYRGSFWSGKLGEFGFNQEEFLLIGTAGGDGSEEAPAVSTRRECAHWLLVVWSWTRELRLIF